jgi:hypothetical protein
MPIKNTTILSETKRAIAENKVIKIAAGGNGLALYISKVGGRSWIYQYKYLGKGQTLTLGKYPFVSELDAIGLLVKARADLAKGLNPAAVKRDSKKAMERDELRSEHRIHPDIYMNEILLTLRRIDSVLPLILNKLDLKPRTTLKPR